MRNINESELIAAFEEELKDDKIFPIYFEDEVLNLLHAALKRLPEEQVDSIPENPNERLSVLLATSLRWLDRDGMKHLSGALVERIPRDYSFDSLRGYEIFCEKHSEVIYANDMLSAILIFTERNQGEKVIFADDIQFRKEEKESIVELERLPEERDGVVEAEKLANEYLFKTGIHDSAEITKHDFLEGYYAHAATHPYTNQDIWNVVSVIEDAICENRIIRTAVSDYLSTLPAAKDSGKVPVVTDEEVLKEFPITAGTAMNYYRREGAKWMRDQLTK